MILRVTKYGEPILRKSGHKITNFDKKLAILAQDMIETMHAEDGIGLAAQQVNHAIQLFVMSLGDNNEQVDFEYRYDGRNLPLDLIMPMVVCNPTIKALSDETDLMGEGCLSFPELRLDDIKRSEAIQMNFQDVNGADHVLECTGLLARCCQHEYDHLQGKLFIDRAQKSVIRSEQAMINQIKSDSEEFLKG